MGLMVHAVYDVNMVTDACTPVALDALQMNATCGTGLALRVRAGITVHAVAKDVDRTVANAQTIIPVKNANLLIGENIVRRVAAVAVRMAYVNS